MATAAYNFVVAPLRRSRVARSNEHADILIGRAAAAVESHVASLTSPTNNTEREAALASLNAMLASARRAADAAQRGLDTLLQDDQVIDADETNIASWSEDGEPPSPILTRKTSSGANLLASGAALGQSEPSPAHSRERTVRLMRSAWIATKAFQASGHLSEFSIATSSHDAAEDLAAYRLSLENVLDICNIQGPKMLAIVRAVLRTPRPWDSPAALITITKALSDELETPAASIRSLQQNVEQHMRAVEALFATAAAYDGGAYAAAGHAPAHASGQSTSAPASSSPPLSTSSSSSSSSSSTCNGSLVV